MDNVVALPDRGVTCPECGSAWFHAAITLSSDHRPTGYLLPVKCVECGEEVPPWLA